jgi:amino acid transporter
VAKKPPLIENGATWAIISALVIFGLTYFGIKISADAGVVLGIVEIAVFVLLSAWLIVVAGDNNYRLRSLILLPACKRGWVTGKASSSV